MANLFDTLGPELESAFGLVSEARESISEEPTEGRKQDPVQAQAETDQPGEDRDQVVSSDTIPAIEDLGALAQAIDVDPEWLYGIKIPMGDNQPPIKLGELKDQLTSAQRNAREIEKRLNEQLEAGRAGASMQDDLSRWTDEMVTAKGRMDYLQQQFESINWNDDSLEKGDLAYYRQQYIDAFAKAQAVFTEARAKRDQAAMESFGTYREQQKAKLLEAIPEWSDQAALQRDLSNIMDVAKTYDFSDRDIRAVMDHRVFRLLRDMANLRAQVGQVTDAKAKLAKAPKVLGVRSAAKPSSKNDVDLRIQRARTASPQMRNRLTIDAVNAITKDFI